VTASIRLLHAAARHGRILLVAGLISGILIPSLAAAIRPWLGELVAFLLFLATMRIGPRQAVGALRDLQVTLGVVLVYQLLMPLIAIALLATFGALSGDLATALLLMLSASAISGSPNLTVLTGNDPAPALRLLVVGTALLPLTVVPTFLLIPELGEASDVLAAAARLFAVICVAGIAAFAIRATVLRAPSPSAIFALDGLSAIAMAVVVVGLMVAVGPAITDEPHRFLLWLGIAFAANLGLQLAVSVVLAKTSLAPLHVPFAIVAGNRNVALFLVALPAAITDPILLFIGCYQIPMYLTPILLRRRYMP